jgi:hypothetical protein
LLLNNVRKVGALLFSKAYCHETGRIEIILVESRGLTMLIPKPKIGQHST